MSSLIILHLNYIIVKTLLLIHHWHFSWLVLLLKMLYNFTIHSYLLKFFLKNQSVISFLSLGCLIKEKCLLNSLNIYNTSQLIYSKDRKKSQNSCSKLQYSYQIMTKHIYLRYWEISHKDTWSGFSTFLLAYKPILVRWESSVILECSKT